jgi:hypothetical protein
MQTIIKNRFRYIDIKCVPVDVEYDPLNVKYNSSAINICIDDVK